MSKRGWGLINGQGLGGSLEERAECVLARCMGGDAVCVRGGDCAVCEEGVSGE